MEVVDEQNDFIVATSESADCFGGFTKFETSQKSGCVSKVCGKLEFMFDNLGCKEIRWKSLLVFAKRVFLMDVLNKASDEEKKPSNSKYT